jgi:hypothetical protein
MLLSQLLLAQLKIQFSLLFSQRFSTTFFLYLLVVFFLVGLLFIVGEI